MSDNYQVNQYTEFPAVEQLDTEATEQADRATFKVGDRVEFSSLTPEWRDGTVASVSPLRVRADDTDNLTTEPAAIRLLPITEQAPREPLVVRKKKDCFHPWPGCNCPVVEVTEDGES